jgi:hypothetical protein
MATGMQLRSRRFSVVDVSDPGSTPDGTGVYATGTQLQVKQISMVFLVDSKAIANGSSREATELWLKR